MWSEHVSSRVVEVRSSSRKAQRRRRGRSKQVARRVGEVVGARWKARRRRRLRPDDVVLGTAELGRWAAARARAGTAVSQRQVRSYDGCSRLVEVGWRRRFADAGRLFVAVDVAVSPGEVVVARRSSAVSRRPTRTDAAVACTQSSPLIGNI